MTIPTDAPVQPALLPEAPPTIESHEIPLDRLPADEALIGPAPSRELVEAIRAFGVLVPISVVVRPTRKKVAGGYDVIAGRRRIKAARLLGLERIPAVVVEAPDRGPLPDVLTLQLQQQRNNPATELAAIERLMRSGADESTISRVTGMPVGSIRHRLRLARLVPPLRAAFDAGRIAPFVADRASGLPADQQTALAAVLAEAGRLTQDDVREARSARAADALSALPLDGMTALPSTDLPAELADLAPPPSFLASPAPALPSDDVTVDRATAQAIDQAMSLIRNLLAVADGTAEPGVAAIVTRRAQLFLQEYDRA